jgi:competence protein ComEC
MDEIRRKLEQIDRQLAGRNLHDHIISTCPLVFVAVGLIAGILVQSELNLPVALWSVPLGLFAVTAVLAFFIGQFSSVSRYITAYLALSCFVCLGAIRLAGYKHAGPYDIRNLVSDERKLATVRGVIVTAPVTNEYANWTFSRFKPTDPSSSFYMAVRQVEVIGGWRQATGVVRMQVDEPATDLKTGDTIQVYCWLQRFEPPTNPGQFDTAGYLAARNIFVSASVKSRDGISVLKRSPCDVLAKLRARIKQAATTALVGEMARQDTSRGLLEALLLGYRRDIDSRTYEAFRKTGLLHLISLSGMHLGILFAIIWLAAKTAGFMKPTRAVICAIAICIFLLVVPPRAPTIRAAIICWVFCAAILFRRHANPVNTLSLAAIILLLVRPTQLFEAGWQLSFASVLGVILFTGRTDPFWPARVAEPLGRQKRRTAMRFLYRGASKLGSYMPRMFAVGLAAWLAGAGILLYHFHTITPLASLWTVLAFPLVAGILIVGFVKMLLFWIWPVLSAPFGMIAASLSGLLVWVVRHIAGLGISEILIGHVPLAAVVLYYGMVVFIAFAYFRRPVVKRILCVSVLLVTLPYLGTVKWQRTYHDDLVLTCLDVGHGQAIVAQLPGSANVLFDAGSLYRSNIGTRIVTPFLDDAAVSRIDAILISHNDTDHINGIPEIVEHCKVGGVYTNDAFFDGADTWGTAKCLRDDLSDKGLKIKRLKSELELDSSATVKVLWPNERADESKSLSDNDQSLVSLIEYAGVKILLCSDIEALAQRQLLQLYPELKADVVVVPHHGSAKTLSADFLKQLGASVALCSCDRTQYERMIADSLAPALCPDGRSFYTARDGAVQVCVRRDGTIKMLAPAE